MDEPLLWSVDAPHLYRAVARVRDGAQGCDEAAVEFGIRSAVFDADRGLLLNGEPVKILGACMHLDFGGLGTAVPDAIQAYRIRQLKQFGFNAYRTSHYFATPALLDACDREGMLVLSETRRCSATPEALAELREVVRAGPSRASVILWSLGNEEEFLQAQPQAAAVMRTMRAIVQVCDGTRPVTMGINSHHEAAEGAASALDVIGFNYQWDTWDDMRKIYPKRPFIETEQANTYTTRGVYVDRADEGYLVGYDRGNFWIGRHSPKVRCDGNGSVPG